MNRTVLIVLILLGCSTTKNPAKCVDGVCIDPDRPYCDFDGLVEGTKNECIAVNCTPGALEACRGDIAIKCAESGTDFSNVQCPLGCDPDSYGCRECMTNSQCPQESNPICDPDTNLCRGCTRDDECESLVCDFTLARCMLESDIVYTAPNSFGSCSKNAPCDFSTGVMNSLVFAKTLRMLPGTYTSSLEVRGTATSNSPLKIVATGATVTATGNVPAILVTTGANVEIRNLTSVSQKHIQCGESAPGLSRLRFEGGMITGVGTGGLIELQRCTMEIANSHLTNTALQLQSDTSLKFERVIKSGSFGTGTITVINAARSKIYVLNSLFINTDVQDLIAEDLDFTFAYSTFINNKPFDVCSNQQSHGDARRVKFENSIIYNTQAAGEGLGFGDNGQYVRPDCEYASTIAFPQFFPVPVGLIVEDPLFSDVLNKDFHLRSNSPGIDRATAATVPPSVDLEGRARGTSPDLGAYERP